MINWLTFLSNPLRGPRVEYICNKLGAYNKHDPDRGGVLELSKSMDIPGTVQVPRLIVNIPILYNFPQVSAYYTSNVFIVTHL
jgi:hypothetical protein